MTTTPTLTTLRALHEAALADDKLDGRDEPLSLDELQDLVAPWAAWLVALSAAAPALLAIAAEADRYDAIYHGKTYSDDGAESIADLHEHARRMREALGALGAK